MATSVLEMPGHFLLWHTSSCVDMLPMLKLWYVSWCPEIISHGVFTWQRSLRLQGHQSRCEEAVLVQELTLA